MNYSLQCELKQTTTATSTTTTKYSCNKMLRACKFYDVRLMHKNDFSALKNDKKEQINATHIHQNNVTTAALWAHDKQKYGKNFLFASVVIIN